jgi:hypothetical protein
VADGFAVDDRVADLPGLVGDQSAPDGIAFGPEIFPFIIKAPASRLTTTPSDTQSTRVQIPPS